MRFSRVAAAGLFALLLSGAPAQSSAWVAAQADPSVSLTPPPSREAAIFGPSAFSEVDHGMGISLPAAGFDLRATGEFPERMTDALVRSAAASDARLVGLMPISPEYAPLGIGSAAAKSGSGVMAGFVSRVPGMPRPEVLIVLAAVALASVMFLRRRRHRAPRHYFAYGA